MLAISDSDYTLPDTHDWKTVHSSRLPGCCACFHCGAWGHHLVLSQIGRGKDEINNENRRCAACARAQLDHAAFSTAGLQCACYSRAEFVDVTPGFNGGVLKGPTTRAVDRSPVDSDEAATARAEAALACARGGELKANTNAWEYPIITGCPCAVQYVVRWAGSSAICRSRTDGKQSSSSSEFSECVGGGDVLGSSRDVVDGKYVGGTDDALDFLLGQGEVIVGVELAVTTLQQPGDRAVFVVRADYAFGSRGDGFKIPPNAPPLEIDIELVFARAPLPLLPKGPALAQQQKERKARERAHVDASTAPLQERLTAAATQRELGNACVGRGAFADAKEAYDRGFTSLVVTTDEWDGDKEENGSDGSDSSGLPARPPMPPSDKALVAAEKARLHCNRALVNLKLQRWEPAVWDSSRVLDFDSAWGMYARDAGILPKELQEPSPGASDTSIAQAEVPDPVSAAGQVNSNSDTHANAAQFLGNLPGHLVSKARIRKACALLELAQLELMDRASRAAKVKIPGSQRDGDDAKAASLHRDAETCLATAAMALRHCIAAAAARDASEGNIATGRTSAHGAASAADDAVGLLSAVEKLEAKKCKLVGSRVAQARAAHEAAWAKVCRDRIIGGLDRANKSALPSLDGPANEKTASNRTHRGEAGLLPDDSMSDLPELSDSDSD